MTHDYDLATAWAFVLAFVIFAYVVLDGFDLGIGILFPAFRVGHDRDQAMNSVAPVWDGNETWLVLGGGGLMAAFPLAYSVILPATYPLVIAMLLGLIFRGVAFEFRWRDPRHRFIWDAAFCLGSIAAAMAQGVLLGAVLQGIVVAKRSYAGGPLDWLSPFSILTGASLVTGYALLGSCWLIGKAEGGLQDQARRLAFRLGLLTLLAMASVSAATPFLALDYWRRWSGMPYVLVTPLVPLCVVICAIVFFRALRSGGDWKPFQMVLAWFALGYVGLGISMYPYIVPRALTIWDAAAPRSSQVFVLFGVATIMPIIIGYTAWAYYVFRGKTGSAGHGW